MPQWFSSFQTGFRERSFGGTKFLVAVIFCSTEADYRIVADGSGSVFGAGMGGVGFFDIVFIDEIHEAMGLGDSVIMTPFEWFFDDKDFRIGMG